MKIALCFSGLAGGDKGKSGEGSPEGVLNVSYEYFKKHLLDINDIDIFVHSWSVDCEDQIKKLYNPKKSLFEEQIWWDRNPDRNFRKNNHYSKWYSMKKSIELKSQYEKENNITYDFVMNSRLDIAWQTDVDFSKHNADKFYVGNWNRRFYDNGREIKNRLYYNEKIKNYKEKLVGYPHNDEGFIDQWFFANSDNMNKFATLFDHIKEYDKLGKETHDHENSISNHRMSCYHLKQIGLINDLEFAYFLHDDFPLTRRWHCKCGK